MDTDQNPNGEEPSFAGRLRIRDFIFSPPQASGNSKTTASLHADAADGANESSPRRQSARLAVTSSFFEAGRASLSPGKRQHARPAAGASSPSSKPAMPRTGLSAIDRKPTRSKTRGGSARPAAPSSTCSLRAPSASSPSPSRKKRTRVPSTYAAPSTYAHLAPLPDAIAPDLLILFIGLNPGISTARTGHAYAHPSNLFWKLLFSSGITPYPCTPEEDRTLPERLGLGFTNIVSRPSRNGAELSKGEMDAGVGALEDKCATWRPEAVCIVGKSIWESIFRVRKGRTMRKDEFAYGWQDRERRMGTAETAEDNMTDTTPRDDPQWQGARIFVASSTSGLAASLKPAEKEAIWKELGDWCVERRQRRQERELGLKQEESEMEDCKP